MSEEGLLRRVVDITWNRATESTAVPSASIVSEIVAAARAETGAPHVSDEMFMAAADVMNEHGFDVRAPWECDLDDVERERYEGLRAAIEAALHPYPK